MGDSLDNLLEPSHGDLEAERLRVDGGPLELLRHRRNAASLDRAMKALDREIKRACDLAIYGREGE